MIHICTAWSNVGGSTQSFINLTNELNARGYETCFYGPHDFPKDKCNFKTSTHFKVKQNDSVIAHFIRFTKRLNVKKFILSCHETTIFPLDKEQYWNFDKIHFITENQFRFHNIMYPHFILPNIHESTLHQSEKKPEYKVGGVIGSIDKNKNTHISIQKALEDGCELVVLFGRITERDYYNDFVAPLLCDNVVYLGFTDKKQDMYDSLTDVYNYSREEVWGYLVGECRITGTNYHSDIDNYTYMSTDDIIKTWVKELDL